MHSRDGSTRSPRQADAVIFHYLDFAGLWFCSTLVLLDFGFVEVLMDFDSVEKERPHAPLDFVEKERPQARSSRFRPDEQKPAAASRIALPQ